MLSIYSLDLLISAIDNLILLLLNPNLNKEIFNGLRYKTKNILQMDTQTDPKKLRSPHRATRRPLLRLQKMRPLLQ